MLFRSTVFKTVGSTLNLAGAFQSISWVHEDQHRFPDALDAIEEAWKYVELTDSRFDQMNISLDLSKLLFNTNQDTRAWKHIEMVLINASYFGDRLTAARALDYMGYGYLRRGDYQNAYGAYEAAAEKYFGSFDSDSTNWCKKNMAGIERKQGNPNEVVGFYRPPIDSDQSLFYPPVQAFASELPTSYS